MNMKYKLIFSALSLLLLGACKQHTTEEKNNSKYCLTDSLLVKCTLDTVKSEGVINELTLSGKIAFDEDKTIKVLALASGHITDVKVSLGDFVNEGEVLAVIKSSDMAGYYNDLVVAKSNLAIAKKNLEASEGFFKSGLNSEKDLLTAQKEFQNAQSSYNRINEIIKVYGGSGNADENTLATYIIKAPISGFIVEKTVVSGMEIRSDDNTALFTISSLKEVWAIANLYETDIAKVQPGYDVQISTISYKDRLFKGKVDKVSNVLNPETKALNVRIILDNSDYALKPGMFARAVVKYSDGQKMLSVPKNSVVFDENKNFVVTFNNKCDLKMREVNVVKTIGDCVFIEGGSVNNPDSYLSEGERVITRNSLFVFTALKKL